MSNQDEDYERRFNAEMEQAIALSLQAMEVDKIKHEERKRSVEVQFRPRPMATVPPIVPSLPPPPSSSRKHSSSSQVEDLMSFNSPTKPEDPPTANRNAIDSNWEFLSKIEKTEYRPISLDYGFRREVMPRNAPFLKSVNSPLPDILRAVGKKENNNLIDLSPSRSTAPDDERSVLDDFDPLASVRMTNSESEGGFDPFGYMSPASTDSSAGEPIYTETLESDQETQQRTVVDSFRNALVFDSSRVVRTVLPKPPKMKIEHVESWEGSKQLDSFCRMVTELRSEFLYSDKCTNAGLVLAATVDCNYRQQLSVKLVVIAPDTKRSVSFTCDMTTTVEHVISHVVCALENELPNTCSDDYVLKVAGLAEYLAGASKIGEYEYVYQCVKLDRDVQLNLIPSERLVRSLARTARDDLNDVPVLPKQIMLSDPVQPISYDTLTILLDTLEGEIERVVTAARQLSTPGSTFINRFSSIGVEQAVKAICSVMGELTTINIMKALNELEGIINILLKRDVEVVHDNGVYSTVAVTYRNYEHQVENSCESIRQTVHSLIKSYCHAFKVDFRLCDAEDSGRDLEVKSILEATDSVLVGVHALHRPDVLWNYNGYLIEAQVYHGTMPLRSPMRTSKAKLDKGMYPLVPFDFWINIYDIPVAELPRESRIVFSVYGLRPKPPDHEQNKKNPETLYELVELGWSAVQCFDHEGFLTQGNFFLSVWPGAADKRMGPAPEPGWHPVPSHPVLEITLPLLPNRLRFPPKCDLIYEPKPDEFPVISSLNPTLQDWLKDVSLRDTYQKLPNAERELYWNHRNYLTHWPEALPKVLLFAPDWGAASLPHIYSLINRWEKMSSLNAIQLLLPCFPDATVRAYGVSLLRDLSSDELVDYLPQLVEALKFETYDNSELAKFLLEMSLMSPRVAHFLFWQLVQILPGDSPQNALDVVDKDVPTEVARYLYHWRLRILLRALLNISGEAMRKRFLSQQCLVKTLFDAAQALKQCKESARILTLQASLESLHHTLQDEPSALPLSASVSVVGVKVRNCSYFPSKTLPLKMYFMTDEAKQLYPAIFKVGDDLQQDALTLQMIRVMDKLWLKEGLDLKMVTFACIPTGRVRGMIQLVEEAETLRKIQTEHGLTGSFKDRPINEWLAKHNPGALEYERAVKNFTASCAGYCVATYVLGICDRHNDNIMLKTTGHLFHIDFGKFLGDAQMFGNFKRDRAPFVLTPDMAYVINGGDRSTERFQQFVDLCLRAFAIARANNNIILNLLGFMVSAQIPGVRLQSVRYVQDALLPKLTKSQASATFSKLIESSLKSWFTQFNFFLHNLSQIRATSDRDADDLLSFVPKRYRCEDEGRITATQVHNVQKRYDTEKYYVYVIRVEREGQTGASYVFRTYREFCELQQKINHLFPLAQIYSLPAPGKYLGREAISQVAERRKIDIEKFLVSLFSMADEVAHSDIVYTFFHPLLRDQEEANIDSKKHRGTRVVEPRSSVVSGQLKLTLQYERGKFTVMVEHARGLAKVAGGQEPSTFVKVYLLPDRSTKMKTKVVRKNCHPTFMETLVYDKSLEEIRHRELHASVWSYDPLQDNEFLGGILRPLTDFGPNVEISEWFPLTVVPRVLLNEGAHMSINNPIVCRTAHQ